MKRIRCRETPEPVLPKEKGNTATEETSTCTYSLDDSLSSGNSLNSTHAATQKCVIEPNMSPLPEGPVSDDHSFSAKSKDRRVAFNHVHVKEFDRVVGDNPSCSFGVPIS